MENKKPDLEKVSEIRKAVIPLFEQMLNRLSQQTPHVHLPDTLVSKHTIEVDVVVDNIKDVFNELIGKLDNRDEASKNDLTRLLVKFTDSLTQLVLKVQQSNQEYVDSIKSLQKQEQNNRLKEIDKLEKSLTKEVQEVTGNVKVKGLKKLLNELIEATNSIEVRDNVEVSNLPLEKRLNDKGQVELTLPVSIKNWEFMLPISGGGGSNTDDRVFVREEYTYTTVNGEKVPTTVKKWTHNAVITENYEYDSEGNPVVKTRTLESSGGQVGE